MSFRRVVVAVVVVVVVVLLLVCLNWIVPAECINTLRVQSHVYNTTLQSSQYLTFKGATVVERLHVSPFKRKSRV